MRDEVVKRRRWVTEQQFLDLLGASNLIPGPTSTELAIYLGYARAGWRGLVLAGSLFILPAALISLAIAWAYVRYGSTPEATWLLYGIKPVIIAVVLQAIWALANTAVKGWLHAAVGASVLVLYAAGFNEIVLLLGAGLLVMAARNGWRVRPRPPVLALAPGLGAPALPAAVASVAVDPVSLFFVFLKIGAVLYGSGYVLLAFLRNDFVVRLGWLTDQQLIDAVAVGQLTPGPVFTTATFIGYVVAGTSGAALDLPSVVRVRRHRLPDRPSPSWLGLDERVPRRCERRGDRADAGRHLAARAKRGSRLAERRTGARGDRALAEVADQLGVADRGRRGDRRRRPLARSLRRGGGAVSEARRGQAAETERDAAASETSTSSCWRSNGLGT